MKKIILTLLAATILLSFSSCTDKPGNTSETGEPAKTSSEPRLSQFITDVELGTNETPIILR